jgi:hypothetical protein
MDGRGWYQAPRGRTKGVAADTRDLCPREAEKCTFQLRDALEKKEQSLRYYYFLRPRARARSLCLSLSLSLVLAICRALLRVHSVYIHSGALYYGYNKFRV